MALFGYDGTPAATLPPRGRAGGLGRRHAPADDAGAMGMMDGDDGGGKYAGLYAMLAADSRPLAAVFALHPGRGRAVR